MTEKLEVWLDADFLDAPYLVGPCLPPAWT